MSTFSAPAALCQVKEVSTGTSIWPSCGETSAGVCVGSARGSPVWLSRKSKSVEAVTPWPKSSHKVYVPSVKSARSASTRPSTSKNHSNASPSAANWPKPA